MLTIPRRDPLFVVDALHESMSESNPDDDIAQALNRLADAKEREVELLEEQHESFTTFMERLEGAFPDGQAGNNHRVDEDLR